MKPERRIFPFLSLTLAVLLLLSAGLHPVNAEAEETDSLWETVCGKDERCLAADAEENHFLLYNNTQYPETVLSVLDRASGAKRGCRRKRQRTQSGQNMKTLKPWSCAWA